MTSRERITVLLHHYRDVCEGIPEAGPRPDEVLALMGREWNHPSYQRLERLLVVMHERWPRHRQALRARYERYSERRVAFCVVCEAVEPSSEIGRPHLKTRVAGAKQLCRIGAKAPDMLPRVVRTPSGGDAKLVEEAIEWLERSWGGEVELPTALVGYGAGLRRVA